MTTNVKRWLSVATVALAAGLCVIMVMLYVTWPNNAVGVYLHEQRKREANVRALEWGLSRAADPAVQTFYQAWLAEEKGDLDGAIRGFRSLRNATQPGSQWHLKSSLRLGLAYGLDHQPAQELATYQELMEHYPGQSRLSQAMFHLRHSENEQARRLLDDALARDERDGSLGTDRQFALGLRAGLGPARTEPSSGGR